MDLRSMSVLEELLLCEWAAVGAYTIALGACDEGDLKAALRAFEDAHEVLAHRLEEDVAAQGGHVPAPPSSLSGVALPTRVEGASRAALLAVFGTERVAERHYAAAAAEPALDPSARAFVAEARAAQSRRIAWIAARLAPGAARRAA
ncbi:MAG TPA: hypothetical protein VHB21_23565 [Minicystis sp.]|nr:hypothetical protein [Minicystis sp.]